MTAIPDLAVGPRWDGPRVGQYWYSTGEIGALRCSLGLSGSDLAVGQIGILPGGAWAFDRFAEEWRAQGGMSIELADIAVGNAISRCADTSTECLIDFTNGSDWIRIGVYPTPSPDMADSYPIAYFEPARVAAPQIAAIVADHVAEYLAGS